MSVYKCGYVVGDLVRFVRTGMFGWESDKWHKHDGLVLGDIYKVSFIMGDGGTSLEHKGFLHHPNHFEVVK